MDAVSKIMLAAGKSTPVTEEDPAADLLAATRELLEDLIVLLASNDDDDDDDDDDDAKGKDGKKTPPWMNKKGKGGKGKSKSAKCAALASSAILALSGLESSGAADDWVEATAAPLTQADMLALAKGDDHAEPYGDVEYADPGYRGKKRYPIDAKHIHSAIAYFSKASNRSAYTAAQVKHIWSKIKSAAKKHNVDMEAGPKKVAATALLELAGAPMMDPMALTPMDHGPFSGQHAHPHSTTTVAHTKHFHNQDNRHGNAHGGFGY